MNIYNRKMFKPRNARNALNASAGIMPVQKFHAGGAVGHIHAGQTRNIRPTSGGSIFAPRPQSTLRSPITGQSYRGTTPSGRGVTSLQPLDIARRYISGGRTVGFGDDDAISPGEYAALQAGQSSFLTGQAVQDPTDTRLGGAIASLTRPVAQTAAGGGAFVRGLTAQGIQSLLSSPDGAGTDTMGQRVAGMKPGALDQDYLTSLGLNEIDPTAYSAPIGPQPATPSRGVFQGPPTAPYQVDMSNPEDRARIEQERIARAEMDKIGSVVGNEEAELSPTGFLPTTTPSLESATDNALTTSDSSPEPVDQMFMGFGDAPPPEGDGTSTSTTKGGADGTDGSDGAPTSEEEIKRVINSGTKEEQQSTLDGFIKEFMDKAPGYEGADSGLILAKIGFAMAAGKSPNAIENIASAMSDGADMLIKDKAKKDEFNRQLKLSAMQYGFTETGKLRAEDRLEARERRGTVEHVAGPGGVTYNGKTVAEGESVYVSRGDIRDNNLPKGLLGPAALTSLNNKQKAIAAGLKAKLEAKQISVKDYRAELETYNKAVTKAIESEIGVGLLENAMLEVSEGGVTGLAPALKGLAARGGNVFGVEVGKNYETIDEVRDAMRASLQSLVPTTLAASQSANSISNRDIDFLITAYFGKEALNGGVMTFAFTSDKLLKDRLGRAATAMRNAQKSSFATMNTVESTLQPLYRPGTEESAVGGLSEQQSRLQQAGLTSRGTTGFTQLGLTSAGKDDQGRLRFKFG